MNPPRPFTSTELVRVFSVCLLGFGLTVKANPPAPKVDLTEVPLEQLMYNFRVQSVYGASKHEQKLSEAPSSVTIIDAEEIDLYGHRNFAEVLESVRSLYVTNDRNYSYLGVRGFNRPGDYSSRILVLVNGHRVNENVFDSVLIGYEFPLDVDLIQRVEVIRGPSSSIYGNNAFFGVINVITKDAQALDGVRVSTSYGSFDAVKTRLTYGKTFKSDLHLLVSASYYNSPGPDSLYYPAYNTPPYQVNGGIANGTDYERYYKAFASIFYHDLTLEASFSSRKKGVPTGSYGTIFNDPAAETTDKFGWLDLKYDHEFGDGWHFLGRASYDIYNYDGNYPLLSDSGMRYIYSDYAYGRAFNNEFKLTKRLFDRHTLTVGTEMRQNLRQDQGNRDTAIPPSPYYSDHRKTRNNGVYGQVEWAVSKNLMVNAGLRWDHFGSFGDTTNPRVAVIYNPSETTTIKALYGRAYKAPNAYELYYSGPNNKGNRDLVPETITTYELVVEHSLTKTLNVLASGFSYEIKDLINQTLDPADKLLVYRNSDRVTAKGVEMEVNGKIQGNIHTRISYTYQRTEDELTNQELSNSPRHLFKASISVPLWKDRLFSSLEVLYRSRAGTLAGQFAPDYTLANLTLFSRNLFYHTEASLSIYNLFNTTYSHPGAGEHLQDTIEQDGRTFRAKLTFHF